MKKLNLRTTLLSMIIMGVSLTSCQAIAGIFKVGIWVGIIIVIIIVIIIFWLISKAGKNN